MKHQPGVVIALVKSVNDPDGQGRVQVEYPWLSERNQSAWAPMAVALAGKQRGMFFMPEVGDEALVAFEHGDFDHPFIVGFLWNGVDMPPDRNIDTHVRRLKTVSGHVVDFDDRDGRHAITITTQGGQQIEMTDNTAAISISIKNSGHHIDLNDAQETVTVATRNGQQVELSDLTSTIRASVVSGSVITIGPLGISASGFGSTISIDASGVKVNAPAQLLSVLCASANITASAAVNVNASSILNINAPIANFSGILRANVVQASAVVSAAYTPGIGNLLGL